jgi:flagellar motor protein MotB
MAERDDDNQGLVLGLVFSLILLVIALVLGVVLHHRGQAKAAAPVAAVVAAPAADGASVRVVDGVVQFFFAYAKADVASGAAEALAEVIKGVAAGSMAVVSGYTDSSGDPVKNEELAKLRAFAVRDAIKALGVPEDKIQLKKPESIVGGAADQGRRVDVMLAR